MSLKLVPPRKGKTPFWSIRGTYLGVPLDRSTKSRERAQAAKMLQACKRDIERGCVARPGEVTFLDAAVNYMAEMGNDRFVQRVLEHIGDVPLSQVTQQSIDQTSIALYPHASPATRNRQVHTVVSAILKHAGMQTTLRRPKGWRGSKRTHWLKPDQAFRVLNAARELDPEFGIFLIFLCYTGVRLGEALALTVDNLELSEGFAYVAQTKNEDPRGVFLPPFLVDALAAHPRGLDRRGQRVFRFIKCGRLYSLLKATKAAAGPDVAFVTFHTFCHTWATWMRRYGGADEAALISTGRWRDAASVKRYTHVIVSEESRRAANLPVENSWNGKQIEANPLEKKRA